MQRDLDIVRTLLIKARVLPMRPGDVWGIEWSDDLFDIEGVDRDLAIRHFELLMDARFIAAPTTQGMTQFFLRRLTRQGHDFLETVQNPDVWAKSKAAAKKVGGVGFDLFVQIAKAEAKRFASEKLGLSL